MGSAVQFWINSLAASQSILFWFIKDVIYIKCFYARQKKASRWIEYEIIKSCLYEINNTMSFGK